MEYDELLRQERFCLMVLDSCRADVFEQVALERFKKYGGHYRRIWVPWCNTTTWFKSVFREPKYDLVYVSGNPIMWRFARGKFRKFVEAWRVCWVEELRTTHPRCVSAIALLHAYPRMVVHFLQPHYPYLGLTKRRFSVNRAEEALRAERDILEGIRTGRISREEVLAAYVRALRWALTYVEKLLERLRGPRVFVITSDHGEHLGENGVWFHPGDARDDTGHKVLHEVPWLEIKKER